MPMTRAPAPASYHDAMPPLLDVFLIFLRLGLTSFGGPVAHLGYFRTEFVERRRWLDEATYADLVALCQFLPGPASSQVGMALGISRAGLWGALAAWAGFTLPSAALLVAFAFGVGAAGDVAGAGWLRGLKIVAVAIVAQAVLGMARTLTPDRPRLLIALGAAAAALLVPQAAMQVGIIIVAALIGWRWLPVADTPRAPALPVALSRRTGAALLGVFAALLVGLPLLRGALGGPVLALVDSFYRAGSLVFGGGHVVLPLLEAEVVPLGWVTPDAFLAGYGATQAVPGPLFTFSAYLGAVSTVGLPALLAATLTLGAIFLPSFLLVAGALPFWATLRAQPAAQSVLRGVNAGVVGLLLAALYSPVFTAGVHSPADFAFTLGAFALLDALRWPVWLVVALAAALGSLLL